MELKIEKPTKAINSLIFNQETGFSLYQLDGDYYLSGDATKEELLAAYAAHNPATPSELTLDEKLASVGLSVNDLKAALGL
jgi:hypothetical protein